MYQILLSSDKSLITTNKIKIYQRENIIDKIQFIIPKIYEAYDLTTFIAYLKYTDPMNNVHSELLTISEEDYKDDYFLCVLPVDTEFTKYAGDIVMRMQLTKYDEDIGNQYVLTTGETTITISPVNDIYNYIPDESLDSVTQLIGTLDSRIKALDMLGNVYAENIVDDLEIDSETDKLYVTANGTRKGNGVEIVVPSNDGVYDDEPDGVYDIDSIPDDLDLLENGEDNDNSFIEI